MLQKAKYSIAYRTVMCKSKLQSFFSDKKNFMRVGILMSFIIILSSIRVAFGDVLGIGEIWDSIVDAIKDWISGLLSDISSWVADIVLSEFPTNINDFYMHLSGNVISDGTALDGFKKSLTITEPLRTVAFILTNAILVFHLFICAFGNFTEQRNTPLNLIGRYLIATLLQLSAYTISTFFLNATENLIRVTTTYGIQTTGFGNLYNSEVRNSYVYGNAYATADSYQSGVDTFVENLGNTLGFAIDTLLFIPWLISLIIGIVILKQFLTLVVEIYERFIVVCVLHFAMPIGFSFMTSRTTSNITISYFRMYFSQLFLMLYSYISVGIAILMMPGCMFTTDLTRQIFLLAYLKVAQRIDSIMGNLGLNVAHTSGRLFDDILGAGRSLSRMATDMGRMNRSIGNARNRILDGQQLSALKNNNLGDFVNAGMKKGQTAQEATGNFLRRGGVVAGGFDNAGRNNILQAHKNGSAINTTDRAGNELLKQQLGITKDHNPIAGMKGNDFSNVRYDKNGKIHADYMTENGQRKHAVFSYNPLPYDKAVELDVPNMGREDFGGHMYMQETDADGNVASELNFNDKKDMPLGTDENTTDEQNNTAGSNDDNTDTNESVLGGDSDEYNGFNNDTGEYADGSDVLNGEEDNTSLFNDDADSENDSSVLGDTDGYNASNEQGYDNRAEEDADRLDRLDDEERERNNVLNGENEGNGTANNVMLAGATTSSSTMNSDEEDDDSTTIDGDDNSSTYNSQSGETPQPLSADDLMNDDTFAGGYGGNDADVTVGGFDSNNADVSAGGFGGNDTDTTIGGYGDNDTDTSMDGYSSNDANVSAGGFGGNDTDTTIGGYGDNDTDTSMDGYSSNDANVSAGGFGGNDTDTTIGGYGSNTDSDIPLGTPNTPDEAKAINDRTFNEYGVRMDSAVAMTAKSVERDDNNDLNYYDSNGNMIAMQTTRDSVANRSRFGGAGISQGQTFYPESNENSLDKHGEDSWLSSVPSSMQAEFAGKDNKPPQAEEKLPSHVYTVNSTNSISDAKTTTRVVSYADHPVDLSNRSSLEQFLKEDESIASNPKLHVGRNGNPSYYTFNVKPKRTGDNSYDRDNKDSRQRNDNENNKERNTDNKKSGKRSFTNKKR